jgi:hypothetical protein
MSRIAQQYRRETASLLRYYEGKDSPVLKYIERTEKYIGELEKKAQFIDLLEKLEHTELFTSMLCLVKEIFPPDQFLSVVRSGYVKVFSVEFMEYLMSRKNELNRKLTWEQLCDLDYKYENWRVKWLLGNNFTGDSLDYAMKNISLKMLWGIA